MGTGAIGTMAAYALEKGGKASVTAVLRSSFSIVDKQGFNIKSIEHGDVTGWKPTNSRSPHIQLFPPFFCGNMSLTNLTVLNKIPNVTNESSEPFDFVVVTTKNVRDVPPSVAEVIAPAVTSGHTAILLLQNGLNIDRPVVKAFPSNPVLSGITVMGAKEHPKGTIEHKNYDISYIVSSFPSLHSSLGLEAG